MENFLQSETAKSNQQNDQFRQRILDEEMLKNLPGGTIAVLPKTVIPLFI